MRALWTSKAFGAGVSGCSGRRLPWETHTSLQGTSRRLPPRPRPPVYRISTPFSAWPQGDLGATARVSQSPAFDATSKPEAARVAPRCPADRQAKRNQAVSGTERAEAARRPGSADTRLGEPTLRAWRIIGRSSATSPTRASTSTGCTARRSDPQAHGPFPSRSWPGSSPPSRWAARCSRFPG